MNLTCLLQSDEAAIDAHPLRIYPTTIRAAEERGRVNNFFWRAEALKRREPATSKNNSAPNGADEIALTVVPRPRSSFARTPFVLRTGQGC